jgi:membrane protease YdiL (CAAX protease family)
MRVETKALLVFFLIACVPPWIGWSLLTFDVVTGGLWQLLFLTGWGASIGGLVATRMEEGPGGVRRLFGEALRVAAPVRWWLFVAFVPILANAGGVVLYLAMSGNTISFDPASYLALFGPAHLVTFLLGPFGEEFGWRGYLLPRLMRKMSVLFAVLLISVIWAAWHWPLLYEYILAEPGPRIAVLLGDTIYMCAVISAAYLRSGSLLLAMLMHWHINGVREVSSEVFVGLPEGGDNLLQWCLVGVNVVVAALIIPALMRAASDNHLSRRLRS